MISIRCSEVAIALVVLLVAVSGVAAQSVSTVDGEAPESAKIDSDVEVTYRITDLFEDTDAESWQLMVATELEDARWRVEYLNQGGEAEMTEEASGSSATLDPEVTASGNIVTIEVTVQGTTPDVDSWSYPKEETFTAVALTRKGGNLEDDIVTLETHHYTRGSKQARSRLDDARSAIQAAEDRGAGVAKAESTFESAKDAYLNGNFDNAKRLADEAEQQAKGSQESQQFLIYGAGAVVALLLIGGGIYAYRSRQNDYDELG
jgi:hypothetical protein